MINVHDTVGFLGCTSFGNKILTYGYDGAVYFWSPNIDEDGTFELFYLTSGHTGSIKVCVLNVI